MKLETPDLESEAKDSDQDGKEVEIEDKSKSELKKILIIMFQDLSINFTQKNLMKLLKLGIRKRRRVDKIKKKS